MTGTKVIAGKVTEKKIMVCWVWEKALDKDLGTLGSNPASALTNHMTLVFLSLNRQMRRTILGESKEQYTILVNDTALASL